MSDEIETIARVLYGFERNHFDSPFRGVEWEDATQDIRNECLWQARCQVSKREFADLPHISNILRRAGLWNRDQVREALRCGAEIPGLGKKKHETLRSRIMGQVRCSCCDGTGWGQA